MLQEEAEELLVRDIFSNFCLLSKFYELRISDAGVLKKRCSENMQQIYRRTPMPKCDFNKVALQLYGNLTSAWVFSCKSAAYFQNKFFQENLGTIISGIGTRCWVYQNSENQLLVPIKMYKNKSMPDYMTTNFYEIMLEVNG